MIRVTAGCNRALAAIFTMVISSASACATICALGVCPDHPQQTSSHDCESSTSHHSHRSSVPDKPDCSKHAHPSVVFVKSGGVARIELSISAYMRSEEHTSELQSRLHLVCRLLLEKKKIRPKYRLPCS